MKQQGQVFELKARSHGVWMPKTRFHALASGETDPVG